VTSAIVGASSVRQLEDNVAVLRGPALDPEELADIDDALAVAV
jgi:L-glyceraldehyde 3-phosphate reductase